MSIKDMVRIFKALADPTRLRIMLLLRQRELCVCELMAILESEQSRISHQLRILRDAAVVEDRRKGRWIIYAIPEATRPTLDLLLESLWKEQLAKSNEIQEVLSRIPACLERSVRKEDPLSSEGIRRAT